MWRDFTHLEGRRVQPLDVEHPGFAANRDFGIETISKVKASVEGYLGALTYEVG
jgi:hypothetical protein